jgi:hypothetical protein
MDDLTVTLEGEIARWVMARAAEQDKSASRFVLDLLQKERQDEEHYRETMERSLARKPSRINESGKYPSREELYDRPGLR